jgi:hypothetical protein
MGHFSIAVKQKSTGHHPIIPSLISKVWCKRRWRPRMLSNGRACWSATGKRTPLASGWNMWELAKKLEDVVERSRNSRKRMVVWCYLYINQCLSLSTQQHVLLVQCVLLFLLGFAMVMVIFLSVNPEFHLGVVGKQKWPRSDFFLGKPGCKWCKWCKWCKSIGFHQHKKKDVDDASMEIADAKLPYGYDPWLSWLLGCAKLNDSNMNITCKHCDIRGFNGTIIEHNSIGYHYFYLDVHPSQQVVYKPYITHI